MGEGQRQFYFYLFIYKNVLKGTEASGVLGVPECLLPSSWHAARGLEVGGDEKRFPAELGCFLNNFMPER